MIAPTLQHTGARALSRMEQNFSRGKLGGRFNISAAGMKILFSGREPPFRMVAVTSVSTKPFPYVVVWLLMYVIRESKSSSPSAEFILSICADVDVLYSVFYTRLEGVRRRGDAYKGYH